MQTDSLPLCPAGITRNRHLRGPVVAADNAPECCGAAMAEYRALTTGKDSRHPSPFIAEPRVSDRVNTAMNPVLSAGGDPPLDAAGIDSAGVQL